MKIGVIGVQGAVSEHLEALEQVGVGGVWVRKPSQLDEVRALIIPGGESTTISKLMVESGLFSPVKRLGEKGMPILGTCAGLIMLAKEGDEQTKATGSLLGLMDMKVNRNAFGRQRESFEADVDVEGIGKFPGVFIRAPVIEKVHGKCRAIARLEGRIVAAMQDSLMATAFHPELAGDLRIHEFFASLAR